MSQIPEWQSRRARVSTYWLNKSSDLYAAAGALWYCQHGNRSRKVAKALGFASGFDMYIATHATYWMLCGMTVELALKAVAVSKGKKPIATHDLVQLAEQAEITLFTPREKKVLQFLTEAIYWEGRYPVPRKLESMDRSYNLWQAIATRPVKIGTLTGYRGLRRNPLDWSQFKKLRTKSLHGYIQATE